MEQIVKIVLVWAICGCVAYLINLNKPENNHNPSFKWCVLGGVIVLLITVLDLWPTPANSEEEDNLY